MCVTAVMLVASSAAADTGARILQRPAPARDDALYVPAEAAQALARGPEAAQVVDVRPAAEWAGTRIPGSINLPMHEIKARGGLRGRTLLLVDQGWNDRRLERICADLRRRGWGAVAIVDGGIPGWLAAGGPVEGTGEGRERLTAIKAAEYLTVRADQGRVAVDPPAAPPAHGVVLHVRDGQAGLERQLRDMDAMERAQVRTVEGPRASARTTPVPKPCSSCP